jgi:SAM-dependent methyltransferase
LNSQSEVNGAAWSYRAYEFWKSHKGLPEDVAKEMTADPQRFLRRHLEFIGDVKDKKIANLLGSNGRKAVPLALLGADVTIVDISAENQRYALELAQAAKVDITYIVADFLELDISKMQSYFDLTYLEGGILHYFSDLYVLSSKIYEILKFGGKLVLNDFHPFKNILNIKDIWAWDNNKLEITGDYFDSALKSGSVAYKKYFPEAEQNAFPDCLLRYWTMGEIISSFAAVGFVIEKLVEIPRDNTYKNIPGEFILVASKLKIERYSRI